MPQELIIALLITGLGAFFAIGLYLNRKTPLPENCELPSLACKHCSSSTCSFSETNRMKNESKEGEINGNSN